jgi:hypothetical protein
LKAADGLMVVEVGNSHFSMAAGKFLLVTNTGMQEISMTALQLDALATRLTPKVVEDITDKINAKDTANNKVVEFEWNAKATSAATFREKKKQFEEWLSGCSTMTFTSKEGQKIRDYRKITLTLTFENYRIAKQTARALYPKFVLFRQQQDVAGKNMWMKAMDHQYDLVNESVAKAWDVKPRVGKHPPQNTSLLRA